MNKENIEIVKPDNNKERLEGMELKGYWPEGDSLIFKRGDFEVLFSVYFLKKFNRWIEEIEKMNKKK